MTGPPDAAGPDPAALIRWYRRYRRDLPWRRPGTSPWAVLVSEVMLQQTPVSRVVPAYHRWQARWPDPAAVAAAPAADLLRAWQGLGYPRRALRLQAAARAVVDDHAGRLPADLARLERLPGVGGYTARAVAAFAYRRRVPVLDTNVRRVLARHRDGRPAAPATLTRAELDRAAVLLPPRGAATWSVALMELGALVCRPRSPRCGECPVAAGCAWQAAGRPGHGTPTARPQRFVGTDRQARGVLLAALCEADRPLPAAALAQRWPDAGQRARALAGLVGDGLAVEQPGGYRLPGAAPG